MYRVVMQHAIKALLGQKKSQREIARQLGIHRDVARRLIKQIEAGEPLGSYQRGKKLDGHEKLLEEYLFQGLSAQLAWQKLYHDKGVAVSYPTVRRCMQQLKGRECFVPMHAEAGQEGQASA